METWYWAPTDAQHTHSLEYLFHVWGINWTSASVYHNHICEMTSKLGNDWLGWKSTGPAPSSNADGHHHQKAHGDWSHELTMWVDTSSLVTSVFVESSGSLVEDACRLHLVHKNKYINLAELKWCWLCGGKWLWFTWRQTQHAFSAGFLIQCLEK